MKHGTYCTRTVRCFSRQMSRTRTLVKSFFRGTNQRWGRRHRAIRNRTGQRKQTSTTSNSLRKTKKTSKSRCPSSCLAHDSPDLWEYARSYVATNWTLPRSVWYGQQLSKRKGMPVRRQTRVKLCTRILIPPITNSKVQSPSDRTQILSSGPATIQRKCNLTKAWLRTKTVDLKCR